MSDIRDIDKNATLLRFRQVLDTEDVEFLRELSQDELIDIIFCACSIISALRLVLPPKAVKHLIERMAAHE